MVGLKEYLFELEQIREIGPDTGGEGEIIGKISP